MTLSTDLKQCSAPASATDVSEVNHSSRPRFPCLHDRLMWLCVLSVCCFICAAFQEKGKTTSTALSPWGRRSAELSVAKQTAMVTASALAGSHHKVNCGGTISTVNNAAGSEDWQERKMTRDITQFTCVALVLTDARRCKNARFTTAVNCLRQTKKALTQQRGHYSQQSSSGSQLNHRPIPEIDASHLQISRQDDSLSQETRSVRHTSSILNHCSSDPHGGSALWEGSSAARLGSALLCRLRVACGLVSFTEGPWRQNTITPPVPNVQCQGAFCGAAAVRTNGGRRPEPRAAPQPLGGRSTPAAGALQPRAGPEAEPFGKAASPAKAAGRPCGCCGRRARRAPVWRTACAGPGAPRCLWGRARPLS